MSSALCADCGLCCNGVLHSFTWVEPDEAARLTALGLQVRPREGGQSFGQPCVALREPLCAIYAERPSHCRRYRCRLLKRLEAGELDLASAQATVARARGALSRVRDALALKPGDPVWPAATARLASHAHAASRRSDSVALAAIAELELLCRAAFLRSGQRPGE